MSHKVHYDIQVEIVPESENKKLSFILTSDEPISIEASVRVLSNVIKNTIKTYKLDPMIVLAQPGDTCEEEK